MTKTLTHDKVLIMKYNIGDKVQLLRDELLDDNYYDKDKSIVTVGTIMQVVAIAPKVFMTKGEGHDSNPYFLNLELLTNNKHNRVRTDFCNVKKLKT